MNESFLIEKLKKTLKQMKFNNRLHEKLFILQIISFLIFHTSFLRVYKQSVKL